VARRIELIIGLPNEPPSMAMNAKDPAMNTKPLNLINCDFDILFSFRRCSLNMLHNTEILFIRQQHLLLSYKMMNWASNERVIASLCEVNKFF